MILSNICGVGMSFNAANSTKTMLPSKTNSKLNHLKIHVENTKAVNMKIREGGQFTLIEHSGKKTHADAELDCIERNGHLASINNLNDYYKVSIVSNKPPEAWLGGRVDLSDGEWIWSDNIIQSRRILMPYYALRCG